MRPNPQRAVFRLSPLSYAAITPPNVIPNVIVRDAFLQIDSKPHIGVTSIKRPVPVEVLDCEERVARFNVLMQDFLRHFSGRSDGYFMVEPRAANLPIAAVILRQITARAFLRMVPKVECKHGDSAVFFPLGVFRARAGRGRIDDTHIGHVARSRAHLRPYAGLDFGELIQQGHKASVTRCGMFRCGLAIDACARENVEHVHLCAVLAARQTIRRPHPLRQPLVDFVMLLEQGFHVARLVDIRLRTRQFQ